MPFKSAGNNLHTANQLNITNHPLTETGWIGQQNNDDFYTFTLNKSSSLNLTLDGLDTDADIKLLNIEGSLVEGSHNRNRRTERINTSLEPGKYYIHIYPGNNGNTYYRLRVNANQTPHSLQFATDKLSYQEGESVLVTPASVSDSNGIQDLAKVDLKLQRNGGYWEDINDIVEFDINSTIENSYSFNHVLSGLDAGQYKLQGIAYDQLGARTNAYEVNFDISPSQAVPSQAPHSQDWFEQYIQDTEIRTIVKEKFADNALDRQDMIAILSSAKDGDVIDSNEFSDLQNLVKAGSELGIPEYVQVLSNKVVNGDYANRNYQNNSLGNLSIGSSATHIDKLINKWFYGGDRPVTPYEYKYSEASLFVDGAHYLDIKQGIINDCFFLASLGAVALKTPNTIESMFIDNGDGTFTVRFWRNGVADYVTVDRYLPTDSLGNFLYASKGNNSADSELWVTLVEKAYAQLNESGWINQDGTNSYIGIGNGGYISDALAHITGNTSYLGNSLDINSVVDSFKSGQMLAFATKSTASEVADNIVAGHAYTLIDYDGLSQTFHLFNPWGNKSSSQPGLIEVTWSEIIASFSYWDYAELKS